jgi:hypothetical protein
MAKILFGPKAERLTASLNFLNLLPIAYTISLGIFLKSLFGGSLFINTTIEIIILILNYMAVQSTLISCFTISNLFVYSLCIGKIGKVYP